MRPLHALLLVAGLFAAVATAGDAAAQTPPADSETARLRAEMDDMRRAFDAQMRALQARIDELEKARGAVPPAPAPAAAPAQPPTAAQPAKPGLSPEEQKKLEAEFAAALAGDSKPAAPEPSRAAAPIAAAGALKLIDIAFDLLSAGGFSTAREADMRRLQGGGHDPKNRGVTVQNAELTLSGVVDPFLRGDANIVLQITEAGETLVELEEAYLTTLALPAGLQVKAGQFYTAFGRLNAQHPHAWAFVDQPVVNSRFMSPDGLRNPGVQVSWLTPLPFFAELVGSVQDAHGETATSFRFSPNEEVAGRVLLDRDVRSPADLLYLARLRTSFDPTDEIALVPGVSALFGPNASGRDARTQIYGVDLYAKWKPLVNEQGWPYVSWQTEAMLRRYEAGGIAVDVPGDGADGVDTSARGAETLVDWGMYSQVVWGFARPWSVGLRYDYAAGEHNEFDLGPNFGVDRAYDSAGDALRDHRGRVSADLTYYPSEFSKLRLQYNYDHSSFLDTEESHGFFLQAEILFGAHGAHKF
ncbi:MAG: hypothetical protein HZA54_05005 [Planctomycetes bacterium]|nr:hypothetical protein [Planctomycetota bacterium]